MCVCLISFLILICLQYVIANKSGLVSEQIVQSPRAAYDDCHYADEYGQYMKMIYV